MRKHLSETARALTLTNASRFGVGTLFTSVIHMGARSSCLWAGDLGSETCRVRPNGDEAPRDSSAYPNVHRLQYTPSAAASGTTPIAAAQRGVECNRIPAQTCLKSWGDTQENAGVL